MVKYLIFIKNFASFFIHQKTGSKIMKKNEIQENNKLCNFNKRTDFIEVKNFATSHGAHNWFGSSIVRNENLNHDK